MVKSSFFRVLAVVVALWLFGATGALAQRHNEGAMRAPGHQAFVVANDVEVQWISGEMRFCERRNLRGLVCGGPLFGNRGFAARDWWRPETYVQARTGLNEFTLLGVQPTPDGRGLVIYFSE